MDNDRINELVEELRDRIMGAIHWLASRLMGDA